MDAGITLSGVHYGVQGKAILHGLDLSLREGRIDVSDIPGKPGCYNAVVFLRPHFQLEELTASIRLVAELPPPAA